MHPTTMWLELATLQEQRVYYAQCPACLANVYSHCPNRGELRFGVDTECVRISSLNIKDTLQRNLYSPSLRRIDTGVIRESLLLGEHKQPGSYDCSGGRPGEVFCGIRGFATWDEGEPGCKAQVRVVRGITLRKELGVKVQPLACKLPP